MMPTERDRLAVERLRRAPAFATTCQCQHYREDEDRSPYLCGEPVMRDGHCRECWVPTVEQWVEMGGRGEPQRVGDEWK